MGATTNAPTLTIRLYSTYVSLCCSYSSCKYVCPALRHSSCCRVSVCYSTVLLSILILLFSSVIFFCMPSLIRVLARIHDPQATHHGANQTSINDIRLVTIGQQDIAGVTVANSTCPICISEMVAGEQARVLPCKHYFHRVVQHIL